MPITKPGFRLPLGAQIFLVCAVLITLAVGAAVAITYVQGRKIAEQSVQRTLDTSSGVQANTKQSQLQQVQNLVQFIAQDPAIVQYFESSTDIELGLGDVMGGTMSLADLLSERREQYGFDLGIFLDADGEVLARTDETEAVKQNLAGDVFLASAISEASPVSGLWRQGNSLLQAAVMPILRGEDLLGFLVLGEAIDNTLAADISKVSGADVAYVFVDNDQAVLSASSLDADTAEALTGFLATRADVRKAIAEAKPLERIDVRLGGRDWIGRVGPVDADAGGALGATVSLTSRDRAYAGFQRILNLVLATGIGSLLAALPLSYLLARAILKPVRTLADAAESAADGHYQTRLSIAGNDELARLSRAFDHLLSDLREKSDIEGYVANLSRFLPEPANERKTHGGGESRITSAAPAIRPPDLATRIVLGIDCRALAKPVSRDQAERLGNGIEQFTRAIDDAAQRAMAHVLAFNGFRAVLGFSGEEPLRRALRTARFLRRDASLPDALSASLAFAVHEGDVVEGLLAMAGGSVPVAGGGTLYQLDRLLSESGEHQMLVAKPMLEQVKQICGHDTQAATGLVSGRAFPVLDLARLDALEPLTARSGGPGGDYATVVTPGTSIAATKRGATQDVVLGSVFAGRYEVLSELGAGGMGVVYKARDLELDDIVAIKMLRGAGLMDAEQLDRLKSEIKLARKITHPNVLRTFDFGDSDGRAYISMEYVRGMTLRYLIKQAGRIPFSAGLRIAKQLCAGLGAAHEVGVLHRDIKPENLILESSGNAKLMDFGIARPIRRSEPGHTQQGMFVGTPHYAAPEQLAGDEVDHRADIYASGVLLCEMFCGKLPFTGSNTMEIYMAQMQQAPIKPSEYWPEIPAGLEALILRCIARRADDRFQSVDELGAALSQLRA
ncbi:MAG: protein kinase [Rhodanobacteraceae bacterium]|nr:protein kinase [Rhodanobacteraceae bacterium]MBL0041600.1 protein kinase [Xanthomonadales bacterium]